MIQINSILSATCFHRSFWDIILQFNFMKDLFYFFRQLRHLTNENYTYLFEALFPSSRTKSFSITQSKVKIRNCTFPNEILKMNSNEYFIKLTTSDKKSASQTERLSSNQHFYNRNVVFRA